MFPRPFKLLSFAYAFHFFQHGFYVRKRPIHLLFGMRRHIACPYQTFAYGRCRRNDGVDVYTPVEKHFAGGKGLYVRICINWYYGRCAVNYIDIFTP